MSNDSSLTAVYHQHGMPAAVLRVEAWPSETPGPTQVRVRLIAAPVNPSDLNLIEGSYGRLRDLPDVPGNEGVGIVEEIGRGVSSLSPGDQVLVAAGSWRQQGLWPESQLIRIPTGLDPLQAAMLRINPATAWALLTEMRKLEPGDWILQNAPTSGVGHSVIALAKRLGLRVLSFFRRPESEAALREAGAEHLLPDQPEAFEPARELLGEEPVPLGLNAVGGESASRLFKLLGEEGMLVTYGAMARQPVRLSNAGLIFGERSARGFWLTRWLERQPPEKIRAIYRELAERLLNEELMIPIDRVYPLEQVRDAVDAAARSGRRGKILLRMQEL